MVSRSSLCEHHMLLEFCRSRHWCRELLALVLILQKRSQAHGILHVIRVTCIAFTLAQKLNADTDIVVAASLLHDIGRGSEEYGIHHAVSSARIAEPILLGLGFPKDKIARVIESIKSHSFSSGRKPLFIEACILSDADKLDALGAIGVYRAIAYGVEVGRSLEETINHYDEKLKSLDNHLCLEFSRRIASRLIRIIREYFEALKAEAYWSLEAEKRLLSMALQSLITNSGANTYASGKNK